MRGWPRSPRARWPGEGTISTAGIRCGGFSGCATRQRAAPARPAVKADGRRAEVELAMTVSAAVAASSSAKMRRLRSRHSGGALLDMDRVGTASATLGAQSNAADDRFGLSRGAGLALPRSRARASAIADGPSRQLRDVVVEPRLETGAREGDSPGLADDAGADDGDGPSAHERSSPWPIRAPVAGSKRMNAGRIDGQADLRAEQRPTCRHRRWREGWLHPVRS